MELPGVKEAVRGKTLVHLSTGSPQEVREIAALLREIGATYLEGAIEVAPSQMGQSDTSILISGDEEAFANTKTLLKDLAGNYVYLGNKIEAAAVMDLATLSYVYGAFVGFIHGAILAEKAGISVSQFGKIVSDIAPNFGEFFAHEGKVIESGDFSITESPMRISIDATQRILDASKSMDINVEFPQFVCALHQRTQAAGLADQEVAALIKVLRK